MVEVIGQNKESAKKTTCHNCGAILRYYRRDVRIWTGTCCGKPETERVIDCPACQAIVEVK